MKNERFNASIRAALPAAALIIVLALFPFTPTPASDIKTLLLVCTGAFGAAFICAAHFIAREPLKTPACFGPIALLFLLLLIAAAATSPDPAATLQALAWFVGLLLLYFVAAQVYDNARQTRPIALAFCTGVAISVVYGLVQRAGLDPFPWDTMGLENPFEEMPGTFGNGNLAAHATILAIVLVLYLAASARRLLWCLGFVPLYLVQMDLSNQRGGLVAIAGAAVLVGAAWLIRRTGARISVAIAGAFAALSAVGVMAGLGVMALLYLRTGLPYPTGEPILLRYHGYSGAVDLVSERPMLGFGPGRYLIENPRKWTAFEMEHYAVNNKWNEHTHNDPLELAVEAGIPAAAAYLLFLFLAMVYGLRMGLAEQEKERRALGFAMAAFCCAFLIDGLFGFNLRAPASAMALFLFAGAFDGVLSSGRVMSAQVSRLARLAIPLCATAAMGLQSLVFASDFLLQQARGARYWHAYADAERILAQAGRLAPWEWRIAGARAANALARDKPEDAIDHLRRSLDRFPNNPQTWVLLARAYIALADATPHLEGISPKERLEWRLTGLERADEAARRALRLCAVLPAAEELLGHAALKRAAWMAETDRADARQNAWRQAEEHFERAIAFQGADRGALYGMLAAARFALGDAQSAEHALLMSLSEDPAHEPSWAALTQYAIVSENDRLLFQTVDRALKELDKDRDSFRGVLETLVTLPERTGDELVAAAEKIAEAAASRQKTQSPPGLIWAADLVAARMEATQMPPNTRALAQYHLGFVYGANEQWTSADALLDAAYDHLPPDWKAAAALNRARILHELHRYDEAADLLRDLIANHGGHPQAQHLLAQSLAKSGKTAAARLEYSMLLRTYSLSEADRTRIQAEMDALDLQP